MTAYLDPTGIVSHDGWFHNGQAWKTPCRVATTANITLSGLQTIDGVVGVADDRVLVKNQSTGSQNGIWFMKSGAWVRAFDMDQDQTTDVKSEEIAGAFVYVVSGTANGGTLWRTTNALGGTIGSTSITWTSVPLSSVDLSAIDFLVGTATGLLSAEIVVGTTPGGELGGTWASPTVDSTHSGSAHADFIAKAIVDAKGDLIAATAADTVARVAVGSDGTFLKADSGAAAGVSWASVSTGQLVVADGHSTPLVFDDIVQNDTGDDFIYGD